jgi:hypothetical protein
MGKVVVSEFITLERCHRRPGGSEGTEFGGWSFRFQAEEGQQFKYEELMASDGPTDGSGDLRGVSHRRGRLWRRPQASSAPR